MIWPVVAYAPKAATKPSIAAQPLNFSASGVMVLLQICSKYKENFTALWVFTHSFWLWELILFIRKAYLIIEVVCPKWVLIFSSSVSCNSPTISVVFFRNGERSKEFHGSYLLDVGPFLPFVRRAWKALPRPNIITSRVLFIFITSVNGMFNPCITENSSPPYLKWLQSIILQQLSS